MTPKSSTDADMGARAETVPAPRPAGLLALVAGLGLLAWILHGGKLQGHWRVDDPALLLHALRYPATGTPRASSARRNPSRSAGDTRHQRPLP